MCWGTVCPLYLNLTTTVQLHSDKETRMELCDGMVSFGFLWDAVQDDVVSSASIFQSVDAVLKLVGA